MLAHDPAEVPDVARRLVAEPEVLAHHDSRRPEVPDQHVLDELARALLREALVEGDHAHLVGAAPQQRLPARIERREQPGRLAPPDHGPRVRPEGCRHHDAVPLSRLLGGPRQDRPVAEVNPVEVAERDDYGAQSTTSALASAPSSLYTASNSSPIITR